MSRIVVMLYGNEQCIGISVQKSVVPKQAYITNYDQAEHKPGIGKNIWAFKARLDRIDGVKEVSIWPYEIRITKAEAFNWDEVAPKVLEVIKKFLRDQTPEIRIDDQRSPFTYNDDSGYPSGRKELFPIDLGFQATEVNATDESSEDETTR